MTLLSYNKFVNIFPANCCHPNLWIIFITILITLDSLFREIIMLYYSFERTKKKRLECLVQIGCLSRLFFSDTKPHKWCCTITTPKSSYVFFLCFVQCSCSSAGDDSSKKCWFNLIKKFFLLFLCLYLFHFISWIEFTSHYLFVVFFFRSTCIQMGKKKNTFV